MQPATGDGTAMNQNELRKLELFPHQVEFIEAALEYAQGGRLLVADDVGLGMAQAAAALVWAMSSQRETKLRALIVAPAPLISFWSDQLARRGITGVVHVDQQEFRRLEARTKADQNPWTALETAVTSLDFVKNEEKLRSLVSVGWDLVILDAAHLGNRLSQRGRVLQSLWESDRVRLMVAMSSTLHAEQIEWLQPRPNNILRRGASDLRDWDEHRILPVAGEIEVAQIHLSSEEREVLTSTIAMLGASAPTSAPNWIAAILLRRAASSLFAFGQSLGRLLSKVDDGASTLANDDNMAGFEVDAPIEGGSAVQSPISPTQARRLLELIEQVPVDSKWSTCARLLFEDQTDTMSSAVIFSDFVDTVDYIVDQLRSSDPSLPVWVLSEATALLERDLAVASIREVGGVLVVTSAASDGLDLSFVNLCLHYDVPPDARSLARRVGLLDRITRISPFRQIVFADGIVSTATSLRKMFEF